MDVIAGIDGCRGRYVVASAAYERPFAPSIRLVDDLAGLLAGPNAPRVVAIDMPVGLPDRVVGPGRAAEQAVRPLLGARQSSVFSIPARAAVYAPDYARACEVAQATSEPPRKVSRQGFGLFPAIRQIDALLRERPDLRGRVFEVHPEVAFWRMNGERPLARPKKVKNRAHLPGLAERRALLVQTGFDADLVAAPPPPGAGADDALDALACLYVAERLARGVARPFPDPPGTDAFGIDIAIWA